MIDGSVHVYSGRLRVNEAEGQTPISAFFKLEVWRKIALSWGGDIPVPGDSERRKPHVLLF